LLGHSQEREKRAFRFSWKHFVTRPREKGEGKGGRGSRWKGRSRKSPGKGRKLIILLVRGEERGKLRMTPFPLKNR